MDDLARQAYAAIITGQWDALRPLLHPYLHWTDANGTLRGRSKVMAMLAQATPVPAEPRSVEVRDGQIYRWHS
ncbi:MAG TPA: nuclear transport factor 2 family protein [Streptosporangiaceae bacterium]|nr:nuclear transport factor 2 family protein [Streptosporangiaceae bacterium]